MGRHKRINALFHIKEAGMNIRRSIKFAVPVMLFFFFSICACGGGGAKVSSTSTTLGQELMDLKSAYDKGVISEKEYKNLKELMIKKN